MYKQQPIEDPTHGSQAPWSVAIAVKDVKQVRAKYLQIEHENVRGVLRQLGFKLFGSAQHVTAKLVHIESHA